MPSNRAKPAVAIQTVLVNIIDSNPTQFASVPGDTSAEKAHHVINGVFDKVHRARSYDPMYEFLQEIGLGWITEMVPPSDRRKIRRWVESANELLQRGAPIGECPDLEDVRFYIVNNSVEEEAKSKPAFRGGVSPKSKRGTAKARPHKVGTSPKTTRYRVQRVPVAVAAPDVGAPGQFAEAKEVVTDLAKRQQTMQSHLEGMATFQQNMMEAQAKVAADLASERKERLDSERELRGRVDDNAMVTTQLVDFMSLNYGFNLNQQPSSNPNNADMDVDMM